MAQTPSLSSLRLFLLVGQTRSFSAAARIAHVSQPALSRTIRMLEEMLGTRLFDRDSRNVGLTRAGEALMPVAERLTADFDHAFSTLSHSFAGEQGRVVIGTLPTFGADALPPVIASFLETRPAVEVIVRDRLSDMLFEQLRDRQIDIAFTTPPGDPAFEFEPLFADECVLVCRKGSSLDRRGPAQWRLFEDNPFIAMSPESSVRKLTDAAFVNANVTVRQLYEPSQLSTVGALVRAGLGITLLPRTAVRMLAAEEIVYRPLEGPSARRTIGLATLAATSLSPAARGFAEHFKRQWRPPGGS